MGKRLMTQQENGNGYSRITGMNTIVWRALCVESSIGVDFREKNI